MPKETSAERDARLMGNFKGSRCYQQLKTDPGFAGSWLMKISDVPKWDIPIVSKNMVKSQKQSTGMLTFKKAEAYAPFDLKVNKEAEMLFENIPELEEFKNTSA